VIPTELIQYYESLVDRQRRKPAEENRHLREYIAEIRDDGKRGSSCAAYAPGRVWHLVVGKSIAWKNQNPDARGASLRRVPLAPIVAISAR
jgi:hypothetical protein